MKELNNINVGVNEFAITSKENNIIGCDSLITCIGILLYSPKYKIAGVLHKAIEGHAYDEDIQQKSENLLLKCGFKLEHEIAYQNNETEANDIRYFIVPSAMNTDKTDNYMKLYDKILRKIGYVPFDEEVVKEAIIKVAFSKTELVNCFLFDASTGKFVTRDIIKEDIIEDMNINLRKGK